MLRSRQVEVRQERSARNALSEAEVKELLGSVDEVWIARYLMERIGEEYGVYVNYHCKPLGADADWNGSGMHANFSNTALRTAGCQDTYNRICAAFGASPEVIKACIDVYGPDNHLRLTGKHETQSIHEFSYGISDRGASIRIPMATVQRNWRGWLEDRRPNSAADPYKVASIIIQTVKQGEASGKSEAVEREVVLA